MASMKAWLAAGMAVVVIAPAGSRSMAQQTGRDDAKNDRTIYDSAMQVEPLGVGQRIPHAMLLTLDGQKTTLSDVVVGRPTVLVFFRGGWCPFCTRHLISLAKIVPELKKRGYQLVAVSPDSVQSMKAAKVKHQLDYLLLGDPRMEAAARLGLAFRLDDATLARYKGFGIKLQPIPGIAGDVLPVPAVYVIDKQGIITFAHFDANYKKRLEASAVLEAAK